MSFEILFINVFPDLNSWNYNLTKFACLINDDSSHSLIIVNYGLIEHNAINIYRQKWEFEKLP